ncbi:MAG: type I-A CRISPR-associated protein Cas5 [Candidatus Bathyarchaeia archaeon]|nr:type I-A CRISPR-associated protein Cas5 [Candidatus Bathyarchaeota archaeon]
MVIAYLIDLEFVWGFQAKVAGLSKTSPSFHYPPPTSFLGAMSEVIAKDYKICEKNGKKIITEFSKNLLAIGLKPLNCVPVGYADLNRIITIKLTCGNPYPDPKDLKRSFDSPAIGKTILSIIDGETPIIRFFIVFKNDYLELNNNVRVNINEDLFWKIHRIGSKESRVSCINVEKCNVNVGYREALTNYSFKLDCVEAIVMEEVQGTWEVETYIDPFNIEVEYQPLDYIKGEKTTPFMIPIKKGLIEPKCKVKLKENFVSYNLNEEVVIGRWLK